MNTKEDTVFSNDCSPAVEVECTGTKVYSFYIVKRHRYDDPHIKAQIHEAHIELYWCNKRRIDIYRAQKSKRAELSSLFSQPESLVPKSEEYRVVFEAKKSHLNDQMRFLAEEMAHILEKRDKFYERIQMLRLQRDKGNAAFFQSLSIMRKAKELAASGNVRDLQAFASYEVDRFMIDWNNDKAFRDTYVKRISPLLCEKHLSQYPEVHVLQEKQASVETMKGGEEVLSKSPQDTHVITDEGKKEFSLYQKPKTEEEDVDVKRISPLLCEKHLSQYPEVHVLQEKQASVETMKGGEEVRSKSPQDTHVITDEGKKEFSLYQKPKTEEEDVDEDTLKQRIREEQLEKSQLAMERKRKLQERAAAKAAVRAQKEAEKKLKECEKKAKKNAAANSSSPSELDQSSEVEQVRTLAVLGNEKHQKARSLLPKQRSFRSKHRRRAIQNCRKVQKYWIWGISSAALAFALMIVVLLLL